MGGVTGTVGFAEGMTASGQCNGFVIVHGHALEGLADVFGRKQRIRIAIRAFRIYVDQTHLHGSQGVFQLALARITAVGFVTGGQPLVFRTPVDIFFRLVDVGATAGEAECFESHRFQCNITSKDVQVSPGKFVAILLFDRPKQATGFIQVAVVGPAAKRCETLRASASTAAAITHTVGASTVPGHTNKKRTIVTVVSRPPVFGVGH